MASYVFDLACKPDNVTVEEISDFMREALIFKLDPVYLDEDEFLNPEVCKFIVKMILKKRLYTTKNTTP